MCPIVPIVVNKSKIAHPKSEIKKGALIRHLK
jgi:hypothetical protein